MCGRSGTPYRQKSRILALNLVQINRNQPKSTQIKSTQIESNQFKSIQINSNQFKSIQINSNPLETRKKQRKPAESRCRSELNSTLCEPIAQRRHMGAQPNPYRAGRVRIEKKSPHKPAAAWRAFNVYFAKRKSTNKKGHFCRLL